MNNTCIYKIQSIKNPNKVYIGSAVDYIKRFRIHRSRLKLNQHHSRKLQRHYNKYGIDDLQFTIVQPCSKNDLIKTEQKYIDELNPFFNGYKIAGSPIGHVVSQSTRDKISVKNKGKKRDSETKLRISASLKGIKRKPRTQEHIDKIILSTINGKGYSKHHRSKTTEHVLYIKENIAIQTQAQIAKHLNIHQSTISKLIKKWDKA